MSEKVLDQELFQYVQGKYKMNDKKAKVALKVAESLCNKCQQEDIDVPKPVEWFLNEDSYRKTWSDREKWFDKLPEDNFKMIFYHNDSYKLYMKFMYDQFSASA